MYETNYSERDLNAISVAKMKNASMSYYFPSPRIDRDYVFYGILCSVLNQVPLSILQISCYPTSTPIVQYDKTDSTGARFWLKLQGENTP